MNKTVTSLSDGRTLIFYDERPGVARHAEDSRGLPPTATTSEVRQDPLRGDWVAIASHRQDRTFLPPTDQCPLCPSRDGRLTEIPSDGYDVVVFENRFPSLTPGHGRCEVVCFTADHDASFADLDIGRARTVIDAWADRTQELGALPDVEQVFCFENRGPEIGVTLAHPHGQIYAYPFVTPRSRRMLDAVRMHAERTGRNLFDELVAAEREDRSRLVVESECWAAFVPYAAHWPFEVHLYPHRRVPDLPALDDAERDDLAAIQLDVLRRLDNVYGVPMPYVAAWHQAPASTDRDIAALHLELFSIRRAPDKLKYLAGSESAMDVFINDVTPEQAARMLRDAPPTRRSR